MPRTTSRWQHSARVSCGDTPTPVAVVVYRTFVEDDVRWIIDYKTARPDGELAAHAERYREQLARYADLFREEGLPVRAGIFYAALGKLIEVLP